MVMKQSTLSFFKKAKEPENDETPEVVVVEPEAVEPEKPKANAKSSKRALPEKSNDKARKRAKKVPSNASL